MEPPAAPPPKVSVVVPNYNHGRFLRQRLQSVFTQTYRDFEVIYLDDASTDDSNDVFREFAGQPGVRAVYGTRNSGSPFGQWNKGVALARGEYVWIAESDDAADPRFLETLVPVLDRHPAVGLVHCGFRRIDERGETTRDSEGWWSELDPVRWARDFVGPGRDELAFLGRWNVISNASGVLLRKDVYRRVGGADESMRLAGDWLLWIQMLLVSDAAFVARPLNLWRWHPATLREQAVRSGVERREIARVLRFYAARTGASARAVESSYHVDKGRAEVRAGRVARALGHASAALRLRPLDRDGWRLMLRALAALRPRFVQ